MSLPWVTLGVLLIAGCALAGAVVATSLQQRQVVLAAARPIQVGQVIVAEDLTTVELTGARGVPVIPAAGKARVVGQRAAVVLLPGMLITQATLGQPAGLGPSEALAGVALEPGRFPPGLGAGARVQVLDTGAANPALSPGAADADAGVEAVRVLGRATVVAVQTPGGGAGGGSVATLKLPLAAAGRVTAAAAAGRLALVLVAEGA